MESWFKITIRLGHSKETLKTFSETPPRIKTVTKRTNSNEQKYKLIGSARVFEEKLCGANQFVENNDFP